MGEKKSKLLIRANLAQYRNLNQKDVKQTAAIPV